MAEENTAGEQNGNTAGTPQPDITKVKEQAQHWQAKATDYEKRYKGIDPDEYHALKVANEELMRERAHKGGEKEQKEFEEHLKTEYEKRYGSKYAELEEKATKAEQQLKELTVVKEGLSKASQMGFLPEVMDVVEDRIRQRCDNVDGQIVVKGPDGKPLPSQDDPRNLMGVEEYLRRLGEEKPMFLASTMVAGGKQPGTKMTGAAGSVIPPGWQQMNQAQRKEHIEAIKAKSSPEAARAFMEEVRKAGI